MPRSVEIPYNATLRREYVRCGRAGCAHCERGPGHGPYWYGYWKDGGRTRKRYIGKWLIGWHVQHEERQAKKRAENESWRQERNGAR